MYAAIIVVLLAGGMKMVPRAPAKETAKVVSLVDTQDETINSTQ